jgi:hypothetical protein
VRRCRQIGQRSITYQLVGTLGVTEVIPQEDRRTGHARRINQMLLGLFLEQHSHPSQAYPTLRELSIDVRDRGLNLHNTFLVSERGISIGGAVYLLARASSASSFV